jgi:hypothetical protein
MYEEDHEEVRVLLSEMVDKIETKNHRFKTIEVSGCQICLFKMFICPCQLLACFLSRKPKQ